MNIKTKTDWIELARITLPALPEYAMENGVSWDADVALKMMQAEDFKLLANRLEKLWIDLPDRAGIRFGPFFALCDLCSERWAIE